MSTLIETDARSRVVIPGHANPRFLAQENEDGSILLQPASVVTDAQLEYDGDPALPERLHRAPHSSPVRRARPRRQRPRPSQPRPPRLPSHRSNPGARWPPGR